MASLQRIWADAPTGILVTGGADHRLLYQNQSCIDLLGVLPLGEPIQRLSPQITALGVDRLTSVLRTGQTVRTDAHTLPMPDMHGRPIVMRYVMAPLGDGANVLWLAVGGLLLWLINRRNSAPARAFSVYPAVIGALIYPSQIPREGGCAAVLALLFLGQALPLMARPVREHVRSSPLPH